MDGKQGFVRSSKENYAKPSTPSVPANSLNPRKYNRTTLTTGRIIPRDKAPGYPDLEKTFQRGRIMMMPPTNKSSSSGKPK
jgi:hypothetical protein